MSIAAFCGIASTQEERAAAFELVYSAYLSRGIGRANPYEMRVTPFHLLETTEVLYAESGGEVVLTMTLIRDGNMGLPMESVYGQEVENLRCQGFALAEVSCLADRHALLEQSFLPVFVSLCHMIIQSAKRHGVGVLLAAMHPRHAQFYERVLGFEQFGGQKIYPSAANRPAVAMMNNFVSDRFRCSKYYELFFNNPISKERLQSVPISDEQKEYFAPMVYCSFARINAA